MSLHDRGRRPDLRLLLAALLVAVAGLAASGCTVRPLHATGPANATDASASSALASIGIKPAASREELEVRNHLIFLLGSGRGEPSQPRYMLDLRVARQTLPLATRAEQIDARDVEVTSAVVVLRSRYLLTDAATGDQIKTGNLESQASYDRSRQEFSSIRAQRDAEDRAARELAELLRLALAQDLERTAPR